MDREFKTCLEKRKLVPFPKSKRLIDKELRSAQNDLDDGKFSLANGRYKWSTIQGYYSMYHTSRALLYSRGYREKSHYCLFVALRAFFSQPGLLGNDSIESFYNARILREEADYGNHFTRGGAETLLREAQLFLDEAERILSYGFEGR